MATRADVDARLAGPLRCGAALAAAGVSAAASGVPPRVPVFDDAVSVALAACGVTPADPAVPGDADVAAVPAASWEKLIDIATLVVLEGAAAALALRATKKQLPDLTLERDAAAIERSLAAWRQRLLTLYGYGAGSLTPGVVRVRTRPRRAEF